MTTTTSRFDYGWVVVAAGALMTCIGFGTMLSLAVFLQPISKAMGWSTAGVSAAATLDFLCMGFAAFAWGTLSDRYGTRIVVLAGSLLLGLGLVSASQAQELWQFQLVLRRADRHCRRQFLCADDGAGERLDRQAPQPRGGAGLRRHGRRAGDGGAEREHADHGL